MLEIHCAGCKLPIAQFLNEVYYPACHHIFCPACVRQGLSQQHTFICPLDYLPVTLCADDSERFYPSLKEWISAASSQEKESAGKVLKSCINFVLFPCQLPKNHPGYETCPYDHSLKSQASEVMWVWTSFCEHCRVRVQTEVCPRCQGASIRKQISQSRPCRPLISHVPTLSPAKPYRG